MEETQLVQEVDMYGHAQERSAMLHALEEKRIVGKAAQARDEVPVATRFAEHKYSAEAVVPGIE